MAEVLGDLVGPNPALRRVTLAWFLVNLGEWTFVTALSIHEYRTNGALALGLVGARFAPGAIAGSALVGPLAKRAPSDVLRTLTLVCGLLVALAAVAISQNAPLGLVLAIVWAEGIVSAPYRAVQAAILPALAQTPRELSAAAGAIPVTKALAWAAGALAGSVGLLVAPVQTLIAAGAAGFLIARLLLGAPGLSVTASSPGAGAGAGSGPGDQPHGGPYGAARTGFQLMARSARSLLILGGARSLTRGLWTSLAVVMSLRLLRLGGSGVGWLMAGAGLGAALAGPLSLRFAGRRRLAKPAAITFALAGLPIALLAAVASPVAAVVLMILWGTAFALADSLSNSLLHRVVDARLLSPSVGALESSKSLLEGLGALLAPALLPALGIRGALVVAGGALPLLVLLCKGGLTVIDHRAERRIRPLAALRLTPSFTGLTMLALESLSSRLDRISAQPGEVIVRQGDLGERFYLIDLGRVSVEVDGYRVADLGPGSSFGEKALLHAKPRSATVIAQQALDLWFLEAEDFVAAVTGAEALTGGPVARSALPTDKPSLDQVLRGVPLLAALDPQDLAAAGRVLDIPAGDELTREGADGDAFYVLLDGQAQVTIHGRAVRRLSPGEWFGEIALIHAVPRTATVTTTTQARVFRLERDTFLEVLSRAARADGRTDHAALPGAGLLV